MVSNMILNISFDYFAKKIVCNYSICEECIQYVVFIGIIYICICYYVNNIMLMFTQQVILFIYFAISIVGLL